ncbi:MAG TPA: sulfatase-like hydrolase/transferase, partial [Nevskiaceae bacterium]|nr:sulfatase-like hydrolase/transferase [Nevskiaceae bacterium]
EFAPEAHEGDPAVFQARAAALPALPPSPVQKADIVVWLNESTFDPRNYHLPGARLPHLRMMDAAPTTRARDHLRVHTYGGKTWLSEFSLLTGLVPDDFGARRNLVFNSVTPNTTSNLVRALKADGYKTVVLMPTFKRFYGAGRTYLGTGFDQVLTLRDFPEYDNVPGDEWDIADSDRLAQAAQTIVERHRAGPDGAQPLLLYLLSIKEHAPYSKKTPIDYALQRVPIKESLQHKLSDYLGKLVKLDNALLALQQALFRNGERPVVFAWFGDHQAYFEEDAPPYTYDLPKPDYLTQFQLRTNFNAPATATGDYFDIAFLPSLLIDYAGARPDDYFAGLSAMRRLCGGLMDECADKALVQSYKAWVFSPGLGLFAQ